MFSPDDTSGDGAGAEEPGVEWPQASTGGDGAGAAEPGARDDVLALAMTFCWTLVILSNP